MSAPLADTDICCQPRLYLVIGVISRITRRSLSPDFRRALAYGPRSDRSCPATRGLKANRHLARRQLNIWTSMIGWQKMAVVGIGLDHFTHLV